MLLLAFIFFVPMIITLAITVACYLDGRTNHYQHEHTFIKFALPAVSVLGGLMLGLVSLVFTVMYIGTTNSAKDLETFYLDNAPIFLEATEEIKEGVRDSSGYFYDAARRDHITVYNGQVQEYKLNVIVYNKDLRRHIFWQNNLFMKGVYGRVTPGTNPLPTLGFNQ